LVAAFATAELEADAAGEAAAELEAEAALGLPAAFAGAAAADEAGGLAAGVADPPHAANSGASSPQPAAATEPRRNVRRPRTFDISMNLRSRSRLAAGKFGPS